MANARPRAIYRNEHWAVGGFACSYPTSRNCCRSLLVQKHFVSMFELRSLTPTTNVPTQPTITSHSTPHSPSPPSLTMTGPAVHSSCIYRLTAVAQNFNSWTSHSQKRSSTKLHLKGKKPLVIYSLHLCDPRTSSQKLPPPFTNPRDHGSPLYASYRRLLRLATAVCKHAWYELLRLLWRIDWSKSFSSFGPWSYDSFTVYRSLDSDFNS